MPLMRAISRVGEDGKITIPRNIRREAKLEPGTSIEIKLGGPMPGQFVTIRTRGRGPRRQRRVKVASTATDAAAS